MLFIFYFCFLNLGTVFTGKRTEFSIIHINYVKNPLESMDDGEFLLPKDK